MKKFPAVSMAKAPSNEDCKKMFDSVFSVRPSAEKPLVSVINLVTDHITKNQQREDGVSGVSSGYTALDKITFGWQPEDLIVIASSIAATWRACTSRGSDGHQ